MVRRGEEFVFANQAIADMCGYESPEELLSLGSILEVVPEHEHERISRYLGARDAGEDAPTCYELQAVRKDGSEWWAENRVQEIVWEGEPAFLTAVNDITARKEAEQALKDSERRFRDIAETASDWFWETDVEHRLTNVSGESEYHVGYWTKARAGRTRFDGRIPEDTDDAKWDAHRADLEARRPFKNFQFRVRGADGAIHHVRISGKPIWSADGEFRGYRGMGSDITEFVEADERARSAQERLAIAIEGLSETFLLFDAEDRLVISNRTWREFSPTIADQIQPGAFFEDILRAQISVGLIPEARGQEEKWLRERLDRHRNPKGPFEMARPEGRWLLVNDRRLPDGGVITVATDISELKRAEQRLRESETRAERAHARLVDAIESLHEGFALVDSDDRLVMTNNRFMELYSELSHLYVPGTSFEDIQHGIAESGLVPEARGREDEWVRERIESHKNPGPPFERRLGPDLWLLASERKTSDGGNRLGAKDSKIEGTGIGLTITKQLVELMNGRIGFESSLGKGSVFWIELPLAADEKPKRGAAKLAKVSGTGNAPKGVSDEHVVLYVEDDPASVKLMETIVGRLTNLVLISTDNAEAALLLAETRRPDIILMDIDLPGMNGIEAIEHLRANDKTRDIPVIALSADAMPEQINKAMEAGFLRYLTKPIKVDKLLDAIDAKPRNTAGAATGA